MITIGIDPDSRAHGVAVFEGRKLSALYNMDLPQLLDHVDKLGADNVVFAIENVISQNFVYARNDKTNKHLQAKVGLSIGRCQQAQAELQRALEHRGMCYVLHKPQKGNWANDKPTFQKLTGWDKRSNEETRSAAFFGYLTVSQYA